MVMSMLQVTLLIHTDNNPRTPESSMPVPHRSPLYEKALVPGPDAEETQVKGLEAFELPVWFLGHQCGILAHYWENLQRKARIL